MPGEAETVEIQPNGGGTESTGASPQSGGGSDLHTQARSLPSESDRIEAEKRGPAPQGEQANQVNYEALLAQKLQEQEKRFNERLSKEFGQFRVLPNELKKIQEALTKQQEKPSLLKGIDPAQRDQLSQLVDEIWKEKYGKDWEGSQSAIKEFQEEKRNLDINSRAMSIVNDPKQWEQLNPILGDIYTQMKKDAREGNQEAVDMVEAIRNDKTGMAVFTLVTLAKQRLSSSLETKNAEAIAKQQKAAKSVASTPASIKKPGGVEMTLEDIQRIPDRKERIRLMEQLIPHESDRF